MTFFKMKDYGNSTYNPHLHFSTQKETKGIIVFKMNYIWNMHIAQVCNVISCRNNSQKVSQTNSEKSSLGKLPAAAAF